MNNENSRPTKDAELMKKAKTRVWLKSIYKGLWIVYFVVNTFLLAVWFLSDRGVFWPGMVIASWGFGLLMLGVIISVVSSPSTLSGVDDKINAEYNRLKNQQ